MPPATPFSQNLAPQDPNRAAALAGIRSRSGGAEAAPPQQGPGMAPGTTVSDKFAELARLIMQTGLTPEVVSAFEGFIQFFQQVVAQAQGGAPGAPPGQAQLPPSQGQPANGGPIPAGPSPLG